jgi:hypothetical protein
MAKRIRLGDADEMFYLFFDRWYDDDSRKLKGFEATHPDMLRQPEWVGCSVKELCPLSDDSALEVMTQIKTMHDAALGDWPKFLSIRKPIKLKWIEAFDQYYDMPHVKELVDRSKPDDFSNDYLVSVCEFGSVLGTVMIDTLPQLAWLASWPYWESSIFDSRTGTIIPVFHWAIKKFSTYVHR